MCLFPVRAELQEFGRPKLNPEGSTQLPCGKCCECKSKRAVEWGLRAHHEIADHDDNCFITLTYDDNNLPSYLVVKEYFQKFMKRLRKKLHKKVRYMVSHEYGGRTGRPHHHAIIFGWNPDNQQKLPINTPSGEPLFSSPELDELWKHGFHSIGTANEKTAYYIASYSLKSSNHTVTNPSTGELVKVTDSMDTSKRPAIGHNYFLRNKQQLIDSKSPIPRYYKKLLERHDPELLETYENNSMLDNLNPRGAHSLYAKFKINNQKEKLSLGALRSTPDKAYEERQYAEQLRLNRDNYVSQLQGNKNAT